MLGPVGPAGYRWQVIPASSSPFAVVSGPLPSLLYPGGGPVVIPVTVSNLGNVPIDMSGIRVHVASSPPGCSAATNAVILPSNVSSAQEVRVPAHRSVALPAQGVLPPRMELLDLPANQDACRNGNFRLTVTGVSNQ